MSLRSFRDRPILPLLVAIFVDMLGVGVSVPVLTVIILDRQQSLLPAGMPFEQRSILFGLLLGSFPLAQFFGAPILGSLSDRFGRKPILIITLAGSMVGYLLFAFGIEIRHLWLLFAARLLDGVTGGNISIAASGIADVSNEQTKARNFGWAGMAFGMGLIFGPYFGGKLSDATLVPFFRLSTPFLFAALLSFVNIALFLVFFRETLTTKSARRIDLLTGLRDIGRAFRFVRLRTMLLVVFLMTFGFNFFVQFFQVYLFEKFAYTPGQIGDLFAYTGLWLALVQGLLVYPISKRFTLTRTVAVSTFLFACTLLLLLAPTTAAPLYAIIPFMALFYGLMDALSTTLVSNMSGPDVQGEIIGIKQSLQSLATAIPPILAGFVATIGLHVPILVASACTFLAWLVFVHGFAGKQDLSASDSTEVQARLPH